jgi:predicted dienelactone hydrolase
MPLSCFFGLGISFLARAAAGDYDPLESPEDVQAFISDMTVHDTARKRDIPLKIYLPQTREPASVVLFSHGLGGSKEGSAYLGKHWSARGYVVVVLQHAGSDESVWKDIPVAQRMAALKNAASAQNLVLRAQDVGAVLNQLAVWNKAGEGDRALNGRLDLTRIGMSGHSFGAQTTQAVCGQSLPLGGQRFTDSRIKAAIAFSPNSPLRGDPKDAFGSVKIPWLVMTGTRDTSPIGNATVESRMVVFPSLPAGDKYQLVLDKAEHSAFGDRELPGEVEKHNPNHHRVILALSTAFWDTYLNDDATAKAWLIGDGPRSVLEPNDQWRMK